MHSKTSGDFGDLIPESCFTDNFDAIDQLSCGKSILIFYVSKKAIQQYGPFQNNIYYYIIINNYNNYKFGSMVQLVQILSRLLYILVGIA